MMSFLSFIFESKIIPKEIFKTRDCFKQKLSKKMYHLATPLYGINLSFVKNAMNSEPFGVKG